MIGYMNEQSDPGPVSSQMGTTDIITYSGMVMPSGYDAICAALETKRSERALLVIASPGGDAHSGFRIARALQHVYGTFDALIPRYCKSAGTLIAIGASRLYLADKSELGPLDVQVKKNDEIVGRNSGLDIVQAVNYLKTQALDGFRTSLRELTEDVGISTRLASDISSKLTTGLFGPIFSQIDPMRLAEMQRALEIAFAYGNRLDEASKNLRVGGLQRLVVGYPSHDFVIDRKEARTIFTSVVQPTGVLSQICESLQAQMAPNMFSATPDVRLFTFSLQLQGEHGETTSNGFNGSASDAPSESAIDGSGEGHVAPEQPSRTNGAASPEEGTA
ncbi:SDH family Clp fold serine proteinase [Variovorax sp. GB1P17]|uniref:SDH family Clp fold serine proteinase n=1 Tax=Variovorax sp. GB1P17 TaxID=3443740 RepID=UPI003F464FB9